MFLRASRPLTRFWLARKDSSNPTQYVPLWSAQLEEEHNRKARHVTLSPVKFSSITIPKFFICEGTEGWGRRLFQAHQPWLNMVVLSEMNQTTFPTIFKLRKKKLIEKTKCLLWCHNTTTHISCSQKGLRWACNFWKDPRRTACAHPDHVLRKKRNIQTTEKVFQLRKGCLAMWEDVENQKSEDVTTISVREVKFSIVRYRTQISLVRRCQYAR